MTYRRQRCPTRRSQLGFIMVGKGRAMLGGGPKWALDLNFLGSDDIDPRITYSGGAGGTYVDSAGVLRPQRANYIRNNTMQGAVVGAPGTLPNFWTASAAGLAVSVAGKGVAADGTSYVDIRLNGTTTGTFSNLNVETTSGIIAGVAGQAWTHSMSLAIVGGSTANVTACRIRLGAYSAVPAYLGEVVATPTDVAPSLTANLQRFSTVGTNAVANTAWMSPYLQLTWANGAVIDITLRIGTPQLEQGLVANAVLQTSGAAVATARIDYDPLVTGSCKGMLLEEQRTNLLTQSADLTGWSTSPASSVAATANAATAPDGTVSAEKIVTNDTLSNGHIFFKLFTGANTTTYCASAFLKAAEYSRASLFLGNTGFNNVSTGALFDLANGTVVTTANGSTATITPWGNGWYRCTVTATSDADGGNYVMSLSPCPAATVGFAGVYTPAATGLGIYAWGAQVEAGAFATSYIPTWTSAVTRTADSAVMTGTNFSSWFNQSEGTFVVEADNLVGSGGTNMGLFDVRQAAGDTINTRMLRMFSGAATLTTQVSDAAGTLFTPTPTAGSAAISGGTLFKAALAWAWTDSNNVAYNGIVGTDKSMVGSVQLAATLLYIGSLNNGTQFPRNGHVRRLRYCQRRLPSALLPGLTA